VCGGGGVCGGSMCGVCCGRCVGVDEGGGSPRALEHSKVCTLCDFGHLATILYFDDSYVYFNHSIRIKLMCPIWCFFPKLPIEILSSF
jgi:hypothetical protein